MHDLNGQQESCTATDSLPILHLRVENLDLRISRDSPPAISALFIKAPFHAEECVAESSAILAPAIISIEVWDLKLQLNPITHAIVDVNQRNLNFTFYGAESLRASDVDFPIFVARRARIIGAKRWPALSKGKRRYKTQSHPLIAEHERHRNTGLRRNRGDTFLCERTWHHWKLGAQECRGPSQMSRFVCQAKKICGRKILAPRCLPRASMHVGPSTKRTGLKASFQNFDKLIVAQNPAVK